MSTEHDSHTVTSPAPGGSSHPRRWHRWVLPNKPRPPINPALIKHAEDRAELGQNRVADAITAFSGSMLFVYIHIVWFGCWIGFGVESYPFGCSR
jgi:hypothetical protein